MKKFGLFFLLILTTFVFGCGGKPTAQAEPLTIEEWKVMPADTTKFAFQTIERLKAGTPKFQNDSEWDKFAHTVFIPAQKKELPNGALRK